VHVLPFSHTFYWELLALLAAGGAGGALYALLLEFDIDRPLAAWLAVGFSVSPTLLVVFLRDGRGVDAAAIFVITLGCLFIVRRQQLALAATLLVGTTIHESCLFLIPLTYAVWARRPLDLRALRDVAAVAVVPIAVYAYLRISIVAVGEAYQPGYTGSFLHGRTDVLRDALQNGGWHVELPGFDDLRARLGASHLLRRARHLRGRGVRRTQPSSARRSHGHRPSRARLWIRRLHAGAWREARTRHNRSACKRTRLLGEACDSLRGWIACGAGRRLLVVVCVRPRRAPARQRPP
jgi:hypothetical protein